jgi:hypothetical protein
VIDRQGQAAARVLVGQEEVPARQDHVLARGDEVDVVWLDGDAVGHLLDRDASAPPEQLDHAALEVGREVLQHDERHAAVLRHGAEERLESLQTTGRGTDPDHVEAALFDRRTLRRAVVRFRTGDWHPNGILVAMTRGATETLFSASPPGLARDFRRQIAGANLARDRSPLACRVSGVAGLAPQLRSRVL